MTRVRHGLAASPRTVTRARGHDQSPNRRTGTSTSSGKQSEKSVAEMEAIFVQAAVSTSQLRERQAFFADVQGVKERIRNVERSTINPSGRFIARWDILTAGALLFTALVTPFEVGFYDRGTKMFIGPINFTCNRIVDLIFIVDIGIQFFLPFRMPVRDGGMLIYDRERIKQHYLRGWFPYDLLTCIPFDLMMMASAAAAGYEGLTGWLDPNLLRVIKFLRFMKLTRIFRIGRIVHRWQDHVGLSYGFLLLTKVVLIVLMAAHWAACLWGFVGATPPTEGSNEDVEWVSYDQQLTWRQRAGVPADAAPFDVYWIGLYVAYGLIFGGNYAAIAPASYYEFGVLAFMALFGSALWVWVLSSMCGMVATLDPSHIEYRQTLDDLNRFCREQTLPANLRVRLREYFRQQEPICRARRQDTLLELMSVRLRGDTTYHMSEHKLRHVPYLCHPDAEPELLCHLTLLLTMRVFSSLERVPCTDLFIVERGLIAKHGKLGMAGHCFGIDFICSSVTLRDMSDAIALTFSQTTGLARDDLFALLADFPVASQIVRKAALRMALARGLAKAAKTLKRADGRWGGVGGEGGSH